MFKNLFSLFYLYIAFFLVRDSFSNRSFLRIVHSESLNTNPPLKEKILAEIYFTNDKINFSEEDLFQFKINYENEEIKISIIKNMNEFELLRGEMRLGKILDLDMGKGYIGMLQEANNENFCIDLMNWKMVLLTNLL